MPDIAKFREVSRRLREAIATGRFREGSRLPSEPQLAKQHGVSRPTISRAMLDLEADHLVERRRGSGTYVRSASPDSLGTRLLGLLVPGRHGPAEIFEVICGELASLARAAGYSVLWGSSHLPNNDTDAHLNHAEEICQQFIDRKVSGVFFAPFELVPRQHETNRRLAESLRRAGIPVILLDCDFYPFPRCSDFDLVGIDNVAAGFLLADHLLKLGCRRILFVARPQSATTVDARIVGMREALVRNRIEFSPSCVRIGDPADLKFARSLVAGRQVDALICANDNTAAILLRSLEPCGIRVPRDLRIVGFDDIKYATLVSVPLTTMHLPCSAIAKAAFTAMQWRINEPTHPAMRFTLMPTLVVRESCGAYMPRTSVTAKKS